MVGFFFIHTEKQKPLVNVASRLPDPTDGNKSGTGRLLGRAPHHGKKLLTTVIRKRGLTNAEESTIMIAGRYTE